MEGEINLKPIKTTLELVEHMEKKGIKFDLVSKEEAADFLEQNNYYLKLASYRVNFEKFQSNSKNFGKYIDLDFGYLKELSTLDHYLRHILLELCMDIEHYMKVILLTTISKNSQEDGYHIVLEFIKNEDPKGKVLQRIQQHKFGTYSKDLIAKYDPQYPVWVFVELISFGDLVHLCSYYDALYGTKLFGTIDHKFINTVRDIRNACAHNNCMLNTVIKKLPKGRQADSRIRNFVRNHSQSPTISNRSINNYLNNEFSYNVLTLIFVYYQLVPARTRKKMFLNLKEFIEGRCSSHKDWFCNQDKLISLYSFWLKFIDNLSQEI